MILAALQAQPLSNVLDHIQRVRNIEPWRIIGPRCDQELKEWVDRKASGDTMPLSEIRVPA